MRIPKAITLTIISLLFIMFNNTYILANKAPVLSVFYFHNTSKNKDVNWLSKGLADMLITDLSQSDDLSVVEREQLQKIIKEQELSMTSLTSEDTALKIGKLFNATTLVTGSFISQGSTIRIDIRLINTETGKVKSIKSSGSINSIFSLQEKLSKKIFLLLNLEIPKGVGSETKSVEAIKNYYKGIDDLDLGKHKSAIKNFKYASSFDPLYSKPQRDLEKAYRFLNNFRKARYQRELSDLYEKVAKLNKRRNENPFITYSQIVMSEKWRKMTSEQRQRFNEKNKVILQCQSPDHCTWTMILAMMDIVSKRNNYYSENFNREESTYKKEKRKVKQKQFQALRELRKLKSTMLKRHIDEMNVLRKNRDKNDYDKNMKLLQEKHKIEKNSMSDKRGKLVAKHKRESSILNKQRDILQKKEKKLELDKKQFSNSILKKVVGIAEDSRLRHKKNRFLPDILYMQLLAFYQMKDFKALNIYAKKYLKTYPRARMISSVEEFYEKSIEKLQNK